MVNIFKTVLNYPADVSLMLANFCCYEDRIPQGALTSSYIASAVLFEVEAKAAIRLRRKNLVYTRLVDDITVSSKNINYDFSFAQNIIEEMLNSLDLPINRSKTSVSYFSTDDLLVHGLRVNYKEPRLPSEEVSRIRASVKNLEKLAQESTYRTSRDYRKSFNRCLGRVNKLARLGHKQHCKLLERVNKISPLPSKGDIKRAIKFIDKLDGWYASHYKEHWYRRCFYRAQVDINILKRTFKKEAKPLQLKLQKIRPPSEDEL